MLATYQWPGNIRELVNVLDFACAVATGDGIDVEDLPEQVFRKVSLHAIKPSEQDPASREIEALKEDLRRANWNISAAARQMGVDRTTLHRRMRRLGVALPPRAL